MQWKDLSEKKCLKNKYFLYFRKIESNWSGGCLGERVKWKNVEQFQLKQSIH
jgi:hypothetical protein